MSKQKPLTELRDADIRRVDAVKGGANGTRFLIAKASAPAGLVSADEVRDLVAEDAYLDAAGAVIKAEIDTLPVGPPVSQGKENSMTVPADQTPAGAAGDPLEDARAVLKQEKLDKRVRKLEKRMAKAKANAAPPSDAPDSEPDADDAPVVKVSLKKAKAAAKTAKLQKRTAKDRIAVEKANRTLAKIGQRSSAAVPATTAPESITKAPAEEQVANAIELIQRAVGPMLAKDRTEITAELTQVSEQLAKVAAIPMPGGPRVVLNRDGSIIGAPDGEAGLSFEQAALAKVAERYPIGSVQREVLEKAAATSAIKDLMLARGQY